MFAPLFKVIEKRAVESENSLSYDLANSSSGPMSFASAEVADRKKPDVRLAATAFSGRAAIELKIGDNWTVKELESALSDQVVTQYLRHEDCSVGCLLVTYAGRHKKEDPDTGQELTFDQIVERLRQKARELEAANSGRFKLAVVGLDLRRS